MATKKKLNQYQFSIECEKNNGLQSYL